MHRCFSKSLLIGGARIAFRFLQRVPTEHRHQLPRGCTVVGGDCRTGLAQAVCRAVVQSSLVAPIAELIAEACICEWPLEIVHQKREIATRRGIDHRLKRGQDRQDQFLRLPIASLVLRECQLAALRMLSAEPNDVGSPLTGETQQRQRKPCPRSDRMPLFKLANLINRPRVIPADPVRI